MKNLTKLIISNIQGAKGISRALIGIVVNDN